MPLERGVTGPGEGSWPGGQAPVLIVGPTAAGKTDVAVLLAKRIGAEIVNADSVQVYRGLDVGSAKPSPADRASVPFHLLDVADPCEQFTVADWLERAEDSLASIALRGSRAVICGGTGLYIRALLSGWSLAATGANAGVRTRLLSEMRTLGPGALHERLTAVDPRTAARLHPNDAVRIVRALEVYEVTGRALSDFQEEDRRTQRNRSASQFGLTMPRAMLYSRIDARVERMVAEGLQKEVETLLAHAPDAKALKSLGYKEMVAYLSGEMDYASTVAAIKQNTRRFAKRQLTWFRADESIRWIDVSALSSAEAAEEVERLLRAQPDGHVVSRGFEPGRKAS